MLGKETFGVELALGAPPDDEEGALELGLIGDLVPGGDEELTDTGGGGAGHLAGRGLVDRDVAPADRRVARLGDELGDPPLRQLGGLGVALEEAHGHAEAAGAGELRGSRVDLGRVQAEELVGDADHDPGAVSGGGIGSGGAAMLEAVESH